MNNGLKKRVLVWALLSILYEERGTMVTYNLMKRLLIPVLWFILSPVALFAGAENELRPVDSSLTTAAGPGNVKKDTITRWNRANDALPLGSIIQEGDAVRIVAYPDTQSFITGTYPIAGDGTIDLPMVGPFRVTTLTRQEMEKRLADHFFRYLRFPYVTVTPLVRVGFIGGFSNPGFYYANPEESFWEALRFSGGPLRQDGLHRMYWERNKCVVSRDMINAVESGKSIHDLGIKSGDQFVVTTKPRRERMESFNQDVVPVLGVLLTAISTTATVFLVYKTSGRF